MPWPSPSPYLTPREAAALTGFAVSTLAHWRVAGKGQGYGPPYVKKHGRIRYPAVALEAWMRAEGLRHTTEEDSRCSL
jgi:hypothetical protein